MTQVRPTFSLIVLHNYLHVSFKTFCHRNIPVEMLNFLRRVGTLHALGRYAHVLRSECTTRVMYIVPEQHRIRLSYRYGLPTLYRCRITIQIMCLAIVASVDVYLILLQRRVRDWISHTTRSAHDGNNTRDVIFRCIQARDTQRFPTIIVMIMAAAGCYPGVYPLAVPRQQSRGARSNGIRTRTAYICPGRTRPRLAPRRIRTFRGHCTLVRCVQTIFPVTAASVGAD